MSDEEPLVTVMMLARDRASLLEEAANSILRQSMSNLELLILDDGSVDDTWVVATGMAQRDPRVRLLRNTTSQGIPRARNQVLAAARGELLAIADSDDISRPNRLKRQSLLLGQSPDIDGCGGAINCFRVAPADGSRPAWHWGLADGRLPFPFPTAMLRTESVRRAGGFDERLPVAEDLDLLYRMWTSGSSFAWLDGDALVDYRLHDGSITTRRIWTRTWCTLRVHLRAAFRYRASLSARGWAIVGQSFIRCVRYAPHAIRR